MSELLLEPEKAQDKKITEAEHTIDNSWQVLRQYTAARIGLGRAGISVPTNHLLAFQLAHAQAQDAVHQLLDIKRLLNDINENDEYSKTSFECLELHSQVNSRAHYLQRPDLGRRLNAESTEILKRASAPTGEPYDLAIVIVDGLSSFAIQKNTSPLLHCLTQHLCQQDLSTEGAFRLAPISIVQQGRVAIGDEIGELLNAKSVLVFIGERPGLSSPDSLGLYLTWAPKVGLTDESRNCISNVRPEGLSYSQAVNKVMYLLKEANQRKLTGIHLKERSEESDAVLVQEETNFLLS